MTSGEIKTIKQAEALAAVKAAGNKGALAMATGTGKSKIGIDWSAEISEELKYRAFYPKFMIIVPTEKLRDENWRDEYYKWGQDYIYDMYVQRSCYASIANIEPQEWDLVIADEWHNITENNCVFFKEHKIKRLLFLSATTPKDPIKLKILEDLGIEVVYSIPLDEAVALGLVSPYKITVVQMNLESILKTVKAGSKEKPFMQTEQGMYNYLTKSISNAPPGQYKNRVLKRMRFIYDLQSKTNAAKEIIKLIPDGMRTLIFCGGIPQADELCEHSFHSKSKSDKNFNDFKSGVIDRMSCVNSVNEGHNIDEGVDVAVVVQLNSNEKDLIQRIGRIVRYKDGHIGNVIILVAMGTSDENWFKSAIDSFNPENITYTTLANILIGNVNLFDN